MNEEEAEALEKYETLRRAADAAHEEYSRLRTIREKNDPAYAGIYKKPERPHAN
jgi:hypothetical protein